MDQALKAQLSDLICRYVQVVDSRQVEKWPELFTEDSLYQVISRENEERGMGVSFILDDSKARIEDRVITIRTIWNGHYNDYQPRHLVSVLDIQPESGTSDTFRMLSNLAVYVTESDGTSHLLAVGEYRDTVVLRDGVAKFKQKKVILDTALLPRYFVYPL